MMQLVCLQCRNAALRCRFSWNERGIEGRGIDDESEVEEVKVVRKVVAESVAMVMAMDDRRLGIRWWKRRCQHGSRETGSNWHKPASGRADNDAPSNRERQPRRQINSERYTIHASPRSRFGSPFIHQPLSSESFGLFAIYRS